MDELKIRKHLSDNNFVFHILKTIDSTSTYLRNLYENGAEDKTVVIANEQTNGRGRRGKSFFSPADSGIYMSVLIKPDFVIDNPAKITTAAAVSVCRAVKKILNLKPQIKWVNDIYINNKKVCGILTEAVSSPKSMEVNSIILGIGINISKPDNDYPPEISSIAAPILESCYIPEGMKERLIAEVLNEFFNLYKQDSASIFSEYKELLFLIGKRIKVIGLENFDAEVLDLAEDFSLIVKKDDGEILNLFSGEISIKLD